MSAPTPKTTTVTWLTVTIDPATGVSDPFDLTAGAIVAIGTPASADVAIFWVEVDIGGEWYTVSESSGAARDFRLLKNRAVPLDSNWTLPYTSARITMPVSTIDYTFQVCVQAF